MRNDLLVRLMFGRSQMKATALACVVENVQSEVKLFLRCSWQETCWTSRIFLFCPSCENASGKLCDAQPGLTHSFQSGGVLVGVATPVLCNDWLGLSPGSGLPSWPLAPTWWQGGAAPLLASLFEDAGV